MALEIWGEGPVLNLEGGIETPGENCEVATPTLLSTLASTEYTFVDEPAMRSSSLKRL